MASIMDQSLFQSAASVYHIYKIIYNSVFQSKYHIQITQADICIHYNCFFAHHGKSCADIGNCCGFSHTALSRCNNNDLTHVSDSS